MSNRSRLYCINTVNGDLLSFSEYFIDIVTLKTIYTNNKGKPLELSDNYKIVDKEDYDLALNSKNNLNEVYVKDRHYTKNRNYLRDIINIFRPKGIK